MKKSLATFGGGCFWCTEAIFKELKGVEKVISGYSGGGIKNPNYYEISEGKSGHAESIQISFDPETISYATLLEVFFLTHNPTSLNRQGNDVGSQYRSIVFYHDEEQKKAAEKMIKKLEEEKTYDSPIVTEVAPYEAFYFAEDYHQDYFKKNSDAPYCQFVIDPKLAKFRQKFSPLLKK
ncbi:peptide-methionine (S)-S-oxide reductase [Candidatus Roizmanbacteria bacterium RIFCSPHIGHO2_01_FULL_39_12c]|uniref:Peptide methionine sulfoxide reductase MsrA n=1 Tax=Candidatus Roizmanbacteria bacterium RIFCSPHIGHO2_01_FULL_39_12c TaxID=1802031 RepID=A0A1F7GCJ9_9BACT|nr:MAG: peptide-methionine (S)-S-oxide reductase [Candidatus Roizmanbacteria bacterium RIFCSPHIGHO2_01_FULL_39_12c]OGK46480.1 MAG: peptide-methionine (S)-S-oxide reductase [Candidatus Roizmanbacteria bacterium RIFCSPLOWO2_01_FULL_40_13]